MPTILFMTGRLIGLLLAALLAAPSPALAAEGRNDQSPGLSLTVLHTADVHSRLLPVDRSGRLCTDHEAPGRYAGGAARVATVAAERRAAGPTLLLDAGDQFQGSLLFSLYQGYAARRMMNALGYDAMALGNHEFDAGLGRLASFVGGLDFPVVDCNVDTADCPALAGLVRPWAILDAAGTPVGVIGALTPETAWLSKGVATVRFSPVATAVGRAVVELRSAGVGVIVLLSHQGIEPDLALAEAVDGLDVIVSGHSHTLLSNTDPHAYGPYPMVAATPSGAPCLVVASGARGTHLGELAVSFDAAGVAQTWSGDSRLLDDAVPRNPTVEDMVRDLATALEPYKKQVAGRLDAPLPFDETVIRHAETALGDLVAEAMLAAGRPAGAQAAVCNAGAIRAGLPGGDVTLADLLTALPFGNVVVTTRLPGLDLLAMLEHGLSRAGGETEGTGRFLQVAGLRLTWNPASRPGLRLLRAEVAAPDGTWAPVDPAGSYVVAGNEYMADGGDGFKALAAHADSRYHTGVTLAEAVRRYMADHAPLTMATDGRISIEQKTE